MDLIQLAKTESAISRQPLSRITKLRLGPPAVPAALLASIQRFGRECPRSNASEPQREAQESTQELRRIFAFTFYFF